jgi:hypothetical protein
MSGSLFEHGNRNTSIPPTMPPAPPFPSVTPCPLPAPLSPSPLPTTTTHTLTTHSPCCTAARMPELRRFRFANARLRTEVTSALLGALPNVEDLDLRQCQGVTEQGVMHLLTALPRLHTVDVTGCRGVTDRVMRRLVHTLSGSLRTLHIGGLPDGGGTGKLSDVAIAELAECKVRLEVSECVYGGKRWGWQLGSC